MLGLDIDIKRHCIRIDVSLSHEPVLVFGSISFVYRELVTLYSLKYQVVQLNIIIKQSE